MLNHRNYNGIFKLDSDSMGGRIQDGLSSIASLLEANPRHLSEDAQLERTTDEDPEAAMQEEETSVESAQLSVFLLFVALILGQLLKHLSININIPYTPILTVVGVFLGMADRIWMNQDKAEDGTLKDNVIHRTTQNYHTPEPALVFLVFLPALIFESAFNSDWYTFRRQFIKILLLAGPMLIFATFLTAFSMYYVLGFQSESNNMSWIACVLFGAIISATDPVAVVALLKELGVSKRISTLIEGESLLNDGTALVTFLVLLDLAEGKDSSAIEIVGKFCKMSLLGPLLGLVFGIGMAYILSRIHNKPILEANLTVCMPYILFYIAEHHSVHVSGILALVSMGLYMTNRGRTRISTESEETIHSIWSYIGFVAETLIFLLTGVVLGGEFIASNTLELIWFAQLIGLYVILHLIRFLGILILLPLLRATGYSFTIKHVLLLAYSGLRGAVGLCLALMVKFNKDIDSKIRDQVMFFTAGIVLLTLIVNATTAGLVVRKLGLAKENEMSIRMLHKVLSQHDKLAEEFIGKWRQERSEHGDRGCFEAEDLDLVALKKYKQQLIKDLHLDAIDKQYPAPQGINEVFHSDSARDSQDGNSNRGHANDELATAPATQRNNQHQESQTGAQATDRPLNTATAPEPQHQPQQSGIKRQFTLMSQYAQVEAKRNMESPEAELRSRYLLEVKAAYLEHYEEGLVAPESLIILERSINEGLDRADTELHDWDYLHGLYQYGCMIRLGIRWQKSCCLGPLVHRWVYKEVEQIYDLFQNYMVCSYHALHLLSEMKSINKKVIDMVIAEVHKNLDECKDELINLRSGYPHLMQQVDTQHCEYYALRQFTKYYQHLGHTGQIDMKHCEMIQIALDKKIKALKLKKVIKKIDFPDQVMHSQLGTIFPREVALGACQGRSDLLVTPAQVIIPDIKRTLPVIDTILQKDENIATQQICNNRVYLISRGCVYEHTKQDFKPEGLDRQFSMRNKAISKHLKNVNKEQVRDKFKNLVTKPNTSEKTKSLKYSKKFSAGKIIGLQNILPVFAEKTEIIMFTDNQMVAEMLEVDVGPLRQVLAEDISALTALWRKLLPSVLLLLFNQKLLEAPHFMTEKDWKTTTKMLAKYADLKVLDADEIITLQAGGFLLQGSLEQVISDDFMLKKKKTMLTDLRKSERNLLGQTDGATEQELIHVRDQAMQANEHLSEKMAESVNDKTTFDAFSTLHPDQVYASDLKLRVSYHAKTKFTVVLAFKDFLKEAWQTANSVAYKNLQKILDQEFVYHNSNTLLARKITGQLIQSAGVDELPFHEQRANDQAMFSMRLLPNYQKTMRARKSNLETIFQSNIKNHIVLENGSILIPASAASKKAIELDGSANISHKFSSESSNSDSVKLFKPINRDQKLASLAIGSFKNERTSKKKPSNWLEEQKEHLERTNGFTRKIATFRSQKSLSEHSKSGTPTSVLAGSKKRLRSNVRQIEEFVEEEHVQEEHGSSLIARQPRKVQFEEINCDASVSELQSDVNDDGALNALKLRQSAAADHKLRVVKTKTSLGQKHMVRNSGGEPRVQAEVVDEEIGQ